MTDLNESLVDAIDALEHLDGSVSIADVADCVALGHDASCGNEEAESLLLIAAIVFIGIGEFSHMHGGRSALELLTEMTESMERKGGKWN